MVESADFIAHAACRVPPATVAQAGEVLRTETEGEGMQPEAGHAEDGTEGGDVIDITTDGEDEDDVDDLLCAQNWKDTQIIGLRVLTEEERKEFHLEFPDGRKRYVRLDDIRRFPHCHAAALDFVIDKAKPRLAQGVKAGRRARSSADAGEAGQGSTLTSEEPAVRNKRSRTSSDGEAARPSTPRQSWTIQQLPTHKRMSKLKMR
jgi:hypothetical protein